VRKPFIHIIQTHDKLPFDVQNMRIIQVDLGSRESIKHAVGAGRCSHRAPTRSGGHDAGSEAMDALDPAITPERRPRPLQPKASDVLRGARKTTRQNLNSPLIRRSRGVMIVVGCSQVPPGTKVLL
jgi:hypothetical protein